MANNNEVAELVAQSNIEELAKQATALNGGSCNFRSGKHLGEGAIMGYANYYAGLLFDDGEGGSSEFPERASAMSASQRGW